MPFLAVWCEHNTEPCSEDKCLDLGALTSRCLAIRAVCFLCYCAPHSCVIVGYCPPSPVFWSNWFHLSVESFRESLSRDFRGLKCWRGLSLVSMLISQGKRPCQMYFVMGDKVKWLSEEPRWQVWCLYSFCALIMSVFFLWNWDFTETITKLCQVIQGQV